MNWKRLFQGKFTQGVLWNLASVVILGIGGITINFIIVTNRGEDALGVFNQVYSIFMLTSQIGLGGIHFSVLKQVSYHQDDLERCGDITTAGLLIAIIIMAITCLVLWLLIPEISRLLDSEDVEQGIRFVIPGIFFIGLNRLLSNTINGLALMREYAVTQALRFIITPIMVFVIVVSPLATPYILLCFSISEFILFCILMGYVYGKLVPLRLVRDIKPRFREHLSYTGRGFFSGAVNTLNTRIDIIMLGYFATDHMVGTYSIASTMIEGFIMIAVAFRSNIDPLLGQYFSQNDNESLQNLFARIWRTVFPLMGALAMSAIIIYPFALSLFIDGETVLSSWLVFIILSIGVTISSYYRVFKGILPQGNKPGWFTISTLLVIAANIVLNILLIPTYGLAGAAIATTLSYVIESAVMVYLVRKLLGLKM